MNTKMLFSTTIFVQDLIAMEYCWADTMTFKNYMLFSMCSITYSSQVVILLSLATSIVGRIWSGWLELTHFQGAVRAPAAQQPAVSWPCYLETQVERWTTCARGPCVRAIQELGSAQAHSQAVQEEGKWIAFDHLHTFASSCGLGTRQSSTQSCSQVPHQLAMQGTGYKLRLAQGVILMQSI